MEVAKRGKAALTVCSSSFIGLGRAQQKALGAPDLPIAIVPHPFGTRSREELRRIAAQCADDIAKLLSEQPTADAAAADAPPGPAPRARLVDVPAALDELNRFFIERRWGDGLIIAPPTEEAVQRMLRHTRRAPDEIVATIAPGMGAATVEYIAIQGVMAGCYPEYLPVLIAAAEAVATSRFHLQAIQATTNPSTAMLIVNGPLARRLGVNSGSGCFGPGTWANATLGRALRLILMNIGHALPGDMDRATQGQPAKYTFCCAENEEANPWEPLHVERGFAADASTVTVVGALGTWNMNMTARDAEDVIAMIGDTMQYPASSDYIYGGAPFVVLAPQHANLFHRAGWSKAEVKRRLWEASKMRAGRSRGSEFERLATARSAELGAIGPDSIVPISKEPEDLSIVVAGGPGSHSVFIPVSAHTRSVTREIVTFE
ncbi:MAG TPA: hypothetical protein VHP37_06010 [Burkholderiales bacterium]|nr:hypothetical protein [Burkholderiales bacterium]